MPLLKETETDLVVLVLTKKMSKTSPNSSNTHKRFRLQSSITMARTRSAGHIPVEAPTAPAPPKKRRLERGEQSRAQTHKTHNEDLHGRGKGRQKEKEEEEYKGVLVIDSDGEDDVLLSEELQIQEVLFMSMQSEKEQGSDKSKLDPIDRKGKQPTKSSSKLETGQTSKLTHAKKVCKICLEWVSRTRIFRIKSCNHYFCNSCIVQYITSKIDENISTIPCPHPSCGVGSLDPLSCQYILPAATFDKWSHVLCESSLGSNKFYCPFKDCSALLINEGGEDVRNCECPHCNRMFCAKCKVPWHGDMSCREFRKLGTDERGREDLMLRNLAKDKKWQRCPQCRMYVEKIDGCMFMKCRCGYCFCYVCASPMSKETHYCITCRR